MARKISNGLVALSSAAVLAVYTAGYLRTKPAADRFTVAAAERRTVAPEERLEAQPTATVPRSVPADAAIVARPASPRPPARPSVAETADAPAPEIIPAPTPSDTPAPPIATLETVPPSPTTAADPEPREPEPATTPAAPPRGPYADGTYTGWGFSRHGDIEATVVVEDGRIASAQISKCRTRYPCSVVDRLPGQILSRQRAVVDVVSGATESAYAYEDAVAEAIAKAK